MRALSQTQITLNNTAWLPTSHSYLLRDTAPGGTSGKESACQCRRHKRYSFDPWVGMIPWSRKWQPTPVFLAGKSHGQRSLVGYSPQGRKESDMTEHTHTHTHTHTQVILSSLHLPHRIDFQLAPLFSVVPFFARKRHSCTIHHFCQIIFPNPREQHYLLFSLSLTEKPLNWMLIFCRPSMSQNGLKNLSWHICISLRSFQRKNCSVKLISGAASLPCSRPPLALYFTLPSLLGQSVIFSSAGILLKSHLCDHTSLQPSRSFEHRRGL